jgi:hypothetical protein
MSEQELIAGEVPRENLIIKELKEALVIGRYSHWPLEMQK